MREGVYEEEDQEAGEEESPWPPCQTASQRFQHGAVAAAVGGVCGRPGGQESHCQQRRRRGQANCNGQVGDVTGTLSSPFVLGGGVDNDDGAHWP